ncbi:NAD(P)/FAD-dependent oxidoreductase, partial [Bacteriovorax sp. DB6_IX]|uniref:NAD(P)/FAD-dependent oxidoreductase n=1 Tax=Bacteriovorax sp. DB6_IX TaxID=1353530 RepID=UPI00038A4CBA
INEYIKSSPELCHIFSELDQETPIKSAGSLKNRNSHIAGEQLAYVGDSAGFIDPLTGEGIFNALQSAYILGDSLKRFPNENGLLAYKKKEKVILRKKIS